MKQYQSDLDWLGDYANGISKVQSIEEILWVTAETVVDRLALEDCVIYIVDEVRNLLVQRSAAGPKARIDRTIVNPIEIPFGSGIVGAAFRENRSILVENTSADERYVQDDEQRLSELSVPVRIHGSTHGVIDSEYTEIGFFTAYHQSAFELVASILGMRIGQLKSEHERNEHAIFHRLNPNPVFRLGKNGELLNANDASYPLLRDLMVSDAPEKHAQLHLHIEAAIADNRYREFNIEAKRRTFKVQIVPVSDFNYVNLYATDVSDLSEARRIAQEANDAKAEFLSVISHELRTPLNAVQGIIGLLNRTPLSAEQKAYIDTLSQSSRNLTMLVNDILDFERLEAGKLSLVETTFDPVASLRTNLSSFRAEARDKGVGFGIELHFPDGAHIVSDELRFLQVVNNLVGNAVKYTDEGQVSVFAKIESSGAGEPVLLFAVKDTGRGIKSSDRDRIFEPFTQLNANAYRPKAGTGLGLAITSKLTNLLKGELSLESAEGQGSTFSVRIPVTLAEPNAKTSNRAHDAIPEKIDLEKLKVLVVDDNEVNVKVIEAYLQIWNAEVHSARNGQEAIVHLQHARADIVIMDIQMPVMDGFETTRILRQTDIGKTLPILGLTADVTPGTEAMAYEVGMDILLTKPFDPQKLSRLLRSYQLGTRAR